MITQAELKQRVVYDPNTGDITWLPRSDDPSGWNKRYAGKPAGTNQSSGYRLFGLHDKLYYAHRIAWLYMTGEFPKCEIDHVNGIKSDNRWCNLRLATSSQNKFNIGTRSNNKSGYKGVNWDKTGKKYIARITVQGERIHLGMFQNAKDASDAYRVASVKYHNQFARCD